MWWMGSGVLPHTSYMVQFDWMRKPLLLLSNENSGFFFENVFHSVLIVYECLYKKLECTIFFFGNQTCSDNQRSCYLLDLLFRNRIKSSTIKFIKTNGSFGISLSIVGSVHITYVFDINRRKLLTEIST